SGNGALNSVSMLTLSCALAIGNPSPNKRTSRVVRFIPYPTFQARPRSSGAERLLDSSARDQSLDRDSGQVHGPRNLKHISSGSDIGSDLVVQHRLNSEVGIFREAKDSFQDTEVRAGLKTESGEHDTRTAHLKRTLG